MSAVYKAIAAVQGELAKTGIAKSRRNKQGEGYMFRGIDDVYAALSPLLSSHGLCVIPRVLERICEERKSFKGNPLFYVTVRAEFDFVSAEDGSVHTAATFGEAMDSGDKATNKAMSAAYKYAAFMTFAIPTEGDNDADATTHEVVARDRQSSEREVSRPANDSSTAIDQEQFGILQALIETSGADIQGICKAYKITALNKLQASDFDRLRRQLDKKLEAKNGTKN